MMVLQACERKTSAGGHTARLKDSEAQVMHATCVYTLPRRMNAESMATRASGKQIIVLMAK
jgi:predicted aconitase